MKTLMVQRKLLKNVNEIHLDYDESRNNEILDFDLNEILIKCCRYCIRVVEFFQELNIKNLYIFAQRLRILN